MKGKAKKLGELRMNAAEFDKTMRLAFQDMPKPGEKAPKTTHQKRRKRKARE